ncbi:methyltransferase family protein, partial [Escherichia coli]
LVLVVAAYALERNAPAELRSADVLRLPGIGLGIAGLALLFGATGYFKWIGTNVNPAGRALKLATGGIYQYTRNPMYVGGCLMFAGLGLAIPSVWL